MAISTEASGPKPTVLIVDDTKENLTVVGELLQPFYRVRVANSGARALKASLGEPVPDLILLDLMMPEMDGYEVLARLRMEPLTQDIPVIFLTAMNADEDEHKGLELGAVDYITKPIRPAILLARVRTQLELKQARDWLKDQNGYLEGEVARRMRENEIIKGVSLHALAALAETRDPETGNHLYRTQSYIEVLARRLAERPGFAAELTEARIGQIVKASPLHDLGKVGIPDHVLLKPGRLTPEEFEVMKTHAALGARAISEAMRKVALDPRFAGDEQGCATSFAFLEEAREIALSHHEKWDGTGYPQGLAGEEVPLAARLMALADVFDALSCRRVYRASIPVQDVIRMILDGRGSHFDPVIVDAFVEAQEDFLRIAGQHADRPSQLENEAPQ